MKTKLLFLVLSFLTFALQAQDLVNFKLQQDGSFVAEDGKSYVVVEYEGMTAQELYSMVKSNVMSLYKSPKTVMSENEPIDLTIHALSSNIEEQSKFPYGFITYDAYYNYAFHFKDGRIKVDAPVITKDLSVYTTGSPYSRTFADLVKGWYEKDGQVMKKKVDKVTKMETIFNTPINYLLKKSNGSQDDDW